MFIGSLLILGLIGFGLFIIIVLFGGIFQILRYKKKQDDFKKEYYSESNDNFDMDKFLGKKNK
jgi:hypothetical protein